MGASTSQTSGFGISSSPRPAPAPARPAPAPARPAPAPPRPAPAPARPAPAPPRPAPAPVAKTPAPTAALAGKYAPTGSQVAGLPPGMYYYDPTPPTKGPAGYKAPGTYNPSQIYNLDPGFKFPSPNLPATTPGLSQKPAPTPTPVAKTPAPAPRPAPAPPPRPAPAPPPRPAQYLAALNAKIGVSNQQKVAELENFLREQKLTGKLSKEYLAEDTTGWDPEAIRARENDPRRFENPYDTAMMEMGGYSIRGAGKDGGRAFMGRNSTKVPYASYVNWEGMSAEDKARFNNMDEPLTPTYEERAKGITIRDKALKQGYYDIDLDFWRELGKKGSEYSDAQYNAWRYGKPFSGDLLASNQETKSPFA